MKNSATDIVIIGAGIAGLAAGCYAQMNERTMGNVSMTSVGMFGDGGISWGIPVGIDPFAAPGI
jgi:glycine/D-amino acid oxidase-like deaminating enzyme